MQSKNIGIFIAILVSASVLSCGNENGNTQDTVVDDMVTAGEDGADSAADPPPDEVQDVSEAGAEEHGDELDISVCDPGAGPFSLTIDNPFMPLTVGKVSVLEGNEGSTAVHLGITVLNEKEIITGVETRVVEERETHDGVLVEVSRNFFVQSPDGTVCYFGEDVDMYDGKVNSPRVQVPRNRLAQPGFLWYFRWKCYRGRRTIHYDGDDLQFTYEDSGFHTLIEPGDPIPAADWLDPVDYYNGEFQIRYVINGPSDQAAGILQTCIWTLGDDGDGRDYFPESCGSFISNDGPGEYLNSSEPDTLAPSTWWKNEDVPLDFSHPERFLIRVVLRGASGCNVTRYDVSGACWDEWPSYENMNFRVIIVMVGAGETFSGWSNYP
jgi:hypothetical protein